MVAFLRETPHRRLQGGVVQRLERVLVGRRLGHVRAELRVVAAPRGCGDATTDVGRRSRGKGPDGREAFRVLARAKESGRQRGEPG